MLRIGQLARSRLIRASCLTQHSATASTSSQKIDGPKPQHGMSMSSEHLQLQNKFKDDMQKNQMMSIYDAIERIEWNGETVNGRVFDKVLTLLTRSTRDVIGVSDRQISTILSVFGSRCDSVSKKQRSIALDRALASLESIEVELGPMSRTAVFAAKIDNGSLPTVADELKAWTDADMKPTSDLIEQFSRVYALQGNTKAIGELIDYMKESNMPIREGLVSQVVYSLALASNASAEPFIKKFSSAMNEVVLRCSAAEAAVNSGRIDDAVLSLASISASARLSQSDNNRHVLKLLATLFEKGHTDAFARLSSFIYTSPDGTTLAEKNNNMLMISHARRARSEGLLLASLDIYNLVHPNFKNVIFEEQIMTSLVDMLKSGNFNLVEALKAARKMENLGLLKNRHLFLLEAAVGTPNMRKVFDHIVAKGKLSELLNEKPSLKMDLGRDLSRELTKENITSEQRTSIIRDVATVLFTRTEGQDPGETYKIIFTLCGNDVEYIIPALKGLSDDRIRRELATAAVQQILVNREDGLRHEKLDKLLQSGEVDSVSGGRISRQLKELVVGRNEENPEKCLQQAAKLFSCAFPRENSRSSDAYSSKILVSLFTDANVPTEKLRDLVELLEKEPRVRMSREEVANAKTALTTAGLTDRCELVERLKAQSQTYARWLQSSVGSLEDELNSMEANPNFKKSVTQAITEVLLRKLSEEKTTDFVLLERILRKISNIENPSYRIKKMSLSLWEKSFSAALREGQLDIAEKFWEIKKSFSVDAAISYISLLFLRGRTAEADMACEELRVSAQTITGGALESAGRLVANADLSKTNDLSNYMRDKFHLKDSQSRRIVAQIRSKQLKELISKGDLEEALQLAVEESKATGVAFGQYDLFRASFEKGAAGMTEKVYMMVLNTHDKTIAILDLAFAMLEQGLSQHAKKLLQTNGLKITTKKLDFFIHRSTEKQKPEVLRGLFFGLNSNGAASIADLNKLLLQLSKLYYKENNFSDLESLEAEVREVSFPVDHQLKNVFDMLKQKKGSSTAEKN